MVLRFELSKALRIHPEPDVPGIEPTEEVLAAKELQSLQRIKLTNTEGPYTMSFQRKGMQTGWIRENI
jgi:hypothetical protein